MPKPCVKSQTECLKLQTAFERRSQHSLVLKKILRNKLRNYLMLGIKIRENSFVLPTDTKLGFYKGQGCKSFSNYYESTLLSILC